MENTHKIVWSESAKNDLHDIYDYYSLFSINLADKIINLIYETVSKLKYPENINIGQFDEFNNNFRRIISGNYKIFYSFIDEQVLIIRIFDSRQNPEKSKY